MIRERRNLRRRFHTIPYKIPRHDYVILFLFFFLSASDQTEFFDFPSPSAVTTPFIVSRKTNLGTAVKTLRKSRSATRFENRGTRPISIRIYRTIQTECPPVFPAAPCPTINRLKIIWIRLIGTFVSRELIDTIESLSIAVRDCKFVISVPGTGILFSFPCYYKIFANIPSSPLSIVFHT